MDKGLPLEVTVKELNPDGMSFLEIVAEGGGEPAVLRSGNPLSLLTVFSTAPESVFSAIYEDGAGQVNHLPELVGQGKPIRVEDLKPLPDDIVAYCVQNNPGLARHLCKVKGFPDFSGWAFDILERVKIYKFGESTKRGYDIGMEAAVSEWHSRYWPIHRELNCVMPSEALSLLDENACGKGVYIHCVSCMNVFRAEGSEKEGYSSQGEPLFFAGGVLHSKLKGYNITGGLCMEHGEMAKSLEGKGKLVQMNRIANEYSLALVMRICGLNPESQQSHQYLQHLQ